MNIALLVLHTALCSILFWSAWCRIVKTSERHTRKSIRSSMALAAMAALVMMAAPWSADLWPWFPRYTPHPVTLVLLASYAAVQVSTARHWLHGVPASFVERRL